MANTRSLHLLYTILYTTLIAITLLYLIPGLTARNWEFFLGRRIPIMAGVLLGGASAAVATLIFQTAAGNRIVTPGIMGMDALYILIQSVLVFMFRASSPLVHDAVLNFLLTTGIMALYAAVVFRRIGSSGSAVQYLLLSGVVLRTLFTSLSNFIQKSISPNEFVMVQNRMLASLSNINATILIPGFIFTAAVIVYLFIRRKTLDTLVLGRSGAINLGTAFNREIRILLILSNALTAVSTAIIGPFAFLGLIGITLTRSIDPSWSHGRLLHSSILITSILLGASFLVIERYLNNFIPLAPGFTIVGGLLFIVLLMRRKSHA